MRTSDLDFDLPADLIAQAPPAQRAASRLLHYRRDDRSIGHRQFIDLPAIFRRGDLLVFNDARVVPARFLLRKSSGGLVEGLYLGIEPDGSWRVLLKNVGTRWAETAFSFADDPDVGVRIVAKAGEEYHIAVSGREPAMQLLARLGRMPLPPYIKRDKRHDERDAMDRQRYQTVYARQDGAVAAPTAGLHFSDELLGELDRVGIERAFVTLHVGLGTFKPVSAENLADHEMHSESYTIEPAAADAITRARREGRRVIAVGTTVARVLESQLDSAIRPRRDQTSIFIYPPYRWKHVDGLITNFHLPRSTLIALVAAMTGLDEQKRIYAEAIAQRYRFFSYGDAMVVE